MNNYQEFCEICKGKMPGSADSRQQYLKCPACGIEGTFRPQPKSLHYPEKDLKVSLMICPNPECQCITTAYFSGNTLLFTLPSIRINLDKKNIPKEVLRNIEEAVECHANGCYVASAIMVRRTLEFICEDQGAIGDSLNNKLQDLKSKITLPQSLFDAMESLRLLGNDATHVKAKFYTSIDDDKVSIIIELTKEIIKALYQLQALVDKLEGKKDINKNQDVR